MTLIAGQATAEFSPGLSRLEAAYEAGEALALSLQAELQQVKEMRADSLGALKAYLSQAALQLKVQHQSQADAWAMALTQGEQQLLALQGQSGGKGARMLSQPDGRLYESQGSLTPLQLITGRSDAFPAGNPVKALEAALPGLWQLLSPHEQASRVSQSIRNVGTGRQRIDYKLSAEQWNALWPQIRPALLDALRAPLSAQPAWLEAAEGYLSRLRFEGTGTLRRILDKDGQPLGLQLMATVSQEGADARRLNLLVGSAPGTGFYLGVRAPAVKGRNQLTLELGLKQSAKAALRSLEGSGRLQHRLDKDSDQYRLALKLKSEDEAGQEKLSGSLGLTEVGGLRRRWTLAPELRIAAGQAEGRLSYTAEQGRSKLLDISLPLKLESAEALPPLPEAEALMLSPEDPAGLEAAREALGGAMLASFRQLLLSLPMAERRGLLHDIGREGRTKGDSVPALDLPDENDDPFLVNDGSSEEETP